MTLQHHDNSESSLWIRRMARGLSLLSASIVIMLLAFNEDFQSNPTLPAVVLWILVLSTLIAWRWETAGGLMTLCLSPVFLLSLLVQWSRSAGPSMSIWELALIGVCLMLPFLFMGLLFVYIGRQSQ